MEMIERLMEVRILSDAPISKGIAMTNAGYVLFVYTYFYADRPNSIGHDYFYIQGKNKFDEEIQTEAKQKVREISKLKGITITDFRISDDDAQLFRKVK